LRQRRRIEEVRGGDLELEADGGQHLSHAGVEFPAQALPFEIDLAHGCAPDAAAPVPDEAGKIALGELQPEIMPQPAALQVEQPGGQRKCPKTECQF
jgi:hypothetical protein